MAVLDLFRLDGRVAVVTGAGGGIGRAIVSAFREVGATVVALDRAISDLDALVGPVGAALPLDVADPAAVSAVFAQVVDRFGGIDVLVNNAGVAYRAPTIGMPVAEWDRVMQVNLRGAVLCAQAAAPSMIARRRGSIINVASQLALAAAPERAAYISSKAALLGLTRSLALEWVDFGVRVNTLAPGVTKTPMTAYLQENPDAGAVFLAKIPMGRFGEPMEIAAAALFLASDASSYLTGQTVVVDGGYSVP